MPAKFISGLALGSGAIFAYNALYAQKKTDYKKVRESVAELLAKPDYDYGTIGPALVRLAWHAAGTYDPVSKTGGCNGSTMRFLKE